MTRLVWGDTDKRLYETGIDRGVFYPRDGIGVPWSGLIAVSETPSDADVTQNHIDGFTYRQARKPGSFAAKIKAYTYPIELDNLRNQLFNFTYRSRRGDDGYLIHLVYNAVVTPPSKSYNSVGANVDPSIFEWDLNTISSFLPTGEMAAHFIVDSTITYPWAIEKLEKLIYGSIDNTPRMPSMVELIQLFEDASILKITDNGDGTWTAEGPDEIIKMLSPTIFEIEWPSALYIDADLYEISSL